MSWMFFKGYDELLKMFVTDLKDKIVSFVFKYNRMKSNLISDSHYLNLKC